LERSEESEGYIKDRSWGIHNKDIAKDIKQYQTKICDSTQDILSYPT
jgi:hypothetical protein